MSVATNNTVSRPALTRVPSARAAAARGAVLIVTLVVISGLSLLALGVAYRARLELRLAQYGFERAYVRELAQAGLLVALDRIRQDKGPSTTLAGAWHADLAIDDRGFLPGAPLRFAGRQSVVVTCTDEESRININKAPEGTLERLPGLGAEALAALADWIDADEDVRRGGAESAYYAQLPVPYRAKNKPLEDIHELLLVRGITPELFFGAGGEDAAAGGSALASALLPSGSQSARPAAPLRALLTVYGNGKLNLNTVGLDVLLTVPGLSERSARELIRVRDGPDGQAGTRDDKPFEGVAALREAVRVSEFEADVLGQFGTLRSDFFRVQARASLDQGRVRCVLEMIVFRNDGKPIPIACREVSGR